MRRLAFIAGIMLLALLWGGPLLSTWRDSFFSHMLAHMGVVAVASPLIAIGLPNAWRPEKSMPATLPLLASLLELIVVWGWHAPAMRALVESSVAATAIEQASFLIAGLFLWCTSIAAVAHRSHAAAGAAALLVTSIHMTLLGSLLSLSQRPLFGAGAVSCLGITLSGVEDQQLGGVVMLLVGAIVYLAGGLYLVASLLNSASVASSSRI